MKKMFKKIIRGIKRELIWLGSKKVLDAINSGATYEEVKMLVEEEVDRKWMKRT
jgi:hypothetical protein